MTKRPSQATQIVTAATSIPDFELFHTPAHEPYVLLPCGTHREVWPLRSNTVRRWLARLYFDCAATAAGSQALHDALGVLEGMALFAGAEHAVHIRLAESDGAVWLDLADDFWQAVRIDASGWEVVHDPPVRFRRPTGMLALPYPARNGNIEELRPFVNVNANEWPLLLGWLVAALRSKGPYGILLVHGEQGSAKSTALRVARALVDPNEAPIRREPKDGHDLIVAARNGAVVAFDNVSRLTPELSDDLARLATGAGFGARQLYTDLEEVIVHVARPIALNGITEVALRGDLLDRGLVLTLPRIRKYQSEDAFWSAFRDAHPRILGALLDAVSIAITNYPTTETPNVRMADFARWVTAAEPGLNLAPESFAAAYRDNRSQAVQAVLESALITRPIQTIAEDGFEGSATALLERLNALEEEGHRRKGWPTAPHVLSGQLRRLAPALRRLGVEVEFEQTRSSRTILIRQALEEIGEQASRASLSVADDEHRDARDACDAPASTSSNGLTAECIVCGGAYRDDPDHPERLRCPACVAAVAA